MERQQKTPVSRLSIIIVSVLLLGTVGVIALTNHLMEDLKDNSEKMRLYKMKAKETPQESVLNLDFIDEQTAETESKESEELYQKFQRLLLLGKPAEAQKALEQSLKIDLNDPKCRSSFFQRRRIQSHSADLAKVRRDLHLYQSALDALDVTDKLLPPKPSDLNLRADIMVLKGDRDGARTIRRAAADVDHTIKTGPTGLTKDLKLGERQN